MTSPINQPLTEEPISVGHAIGESLAGSSSPHFSRPPVEAAELTPEEKLVLAIFQEHRGQTLTPDRAIELTTKAREAHGEAMGEAGRGELTMADVARIVHTLDRELQMSGSSWRIRVVRGVGYILWR